MADDMKKSGYAEAGVNIDRGNTLVERIKPLAKTTLRPEVTGNLGGFGALFDISTLNYQNPVLVSGTDGVGTKIKLAVETGKYDNIGIDLVAMCVNDLLVQGAEPLFFLDYYASSKLDIDVAEQVIQGITHGCQQAGCALIGGETAEMPGMYHDGEFDLAGFCVGVVEKEKIIDGTGTTMGDAVIGIASSGPHSNGYSLIRKILKDSRTKLTDTLASETFAEILLQPTRVYVKPILTLLDKISVKSMAHITGGGLLENIPRGLPGIVQADIDTSSWQWPDIFHWLMDTGQLDKMEMYRTFNCGIGMTLIVAEDEVNQTIQLLNEQGEQARRIGTIGKRQKNEKQVKLN